MKRVYINTNKYENGLTNNNGIPFPTISGKSSIEYYTNSTSYHSDFAEIDDAKNYNFYTLNLDYLQFLCTSIYPLKYLFKNNKNDNIIVTKISSIRNANYLDAHKVYFMNNEICEIYSNPKNVRKSNQEVLIKLSNVVLYSDELNEVTQIILNSFNLIMIEVNNMHIALDGEDVLKINDHFNKWDKSHTIQLSNDNIDIRPEKKNKKLLQWKTWYIGHKSTGISATVYNKKDELRNSQKDYIMDFWIRNNLNIENVGRFELKLWSKKLRKYKINSISMLTPEFLRTIFEEEIKNWFNLYKVRRKDFLNSKKETTIKRGHEIQFIKWSKIPIARTGLKYYEYVSDGSIINARNNISFNLHEILLHPNTSTTAQIEVILKYTSDYCLQDYTKNKIITLLRYNDNNILNELLKRFDIPI